jgi:hypothetical protein
LSVTRNRDDAVTGANTQSNEYLDANGNWVWKIQISNSTPVPAGSAALAAELGFTASGVPANETAALKGASNLSTAPGDDFYIPQSGTQIFGWEPASSGIQTNCAAGCTVTGNANQVFTSLGSDAYTTVGPHDFIQIITRGPSAGLGGQLSSTMTVSGAYGGNGRISEISTSTDHYDIFSNVFVRTAVPGDASMNGVTDDGDFARILVNWGATNATWYDANFNNHTDKVVNDGDFNILLSNFNRVGVIGNGTGAALSAALPEPSAAVLIVLALALACGRHCRFSDRRN